VGLADRLAVDRGVLGALVGILAHQLQLGKLFAHHRQLHLIGPVFSNGNCPDLPAYRLPWFTGLLRIVGLYVGYFMDGHYLFVIHKNIAFIPNSHQLPRR
jgi:hypothetical protein